MKYLNKVFSILLIIGLIFTFLVNSKTYSQLTSVRHDMGKMEQQINESLGWNAFPAYYPNGSYDNQLNVFEYLFLVAEKAIIAEGASPETRTWYKYTNPRILIPQVLNITKKYAPPSIKVNGDEISPPFQGTIDANIKSDVYVKHKFRIGGQLSGIFTMESRSYANQNHNSYILWDTNVEIDLDLDADGVQDMPDQPPINVFFSHSFNFGQRRGLTHYWKTDDPHYNDKSWRHAVAFKSQLMEQGKIPLSARDSLIISMSYSADMINLLIPKELNGNSWKSRGYGGDFNDAGDPVGNETGVVGGEFLSPQYFGFTTLHADLAKNDDSDDVSKPVTCGRLQLVHNLWGGFNWGMPKYDWMSRGIREPRQDVYGGYPDPTTEGEGKVGLQLQGWGPYSLNKGESFNIQYASGAGSVSQELAIEKGTEFMNWYRDGVGTFNNAEKAKFLAQSRDSLVQNLDRAYWAYSRDYDIPDPPPVPDISVIAGPGENYIEWKYPNNDYYDDPDSGIDDFGEWRVYRKYGNFVVDEPSDNGHRDYELLYSTTDKNITKYTDVDAIVGEAYHYMVTAVDDGSQYPSWGLFPSGHKIESSPYVNRTTTNAIAFTPGEFTSDDVLVVPNPYSLSTGSANAMNYTGATNDIHFVNLPPYCTLKIYTATGDLIKTIEHTSGSGNEIWWQMRTDSNQAPVSGVYIVVVSDAKDINNNTLPKNLCKFVIVR